MSMLQKYYTIVVLGDTQAGKSTLLGRLTYLVGGIDKKTIEGFAIEAHKIGYVNNSAYAWVSDQSQDERQSGSTARCHLLNFPTSTHGITAIDTPGARPLLRQAIAGIGHADAALLVVSAASGEFESGFKAGGPTRECLSLAASLGIRSLIVAVTKLDMEAPDEVQARYAEIMAEIGRFCPKLGFAADSIVTVPVSGSLGSNLIIPDPDWADWYRGPTLLTVMNRLDVDILRRQQALPVVETPEELSAIAGLRCTILDVARGASGTATLIGRVVAGSLRPNAVLTAAPSTASIRVDAVHLVGDPDTDRAFALPGDLVRLSLHDVPASLAAGQVLSDAAANRARGVTSFTARLTVLDHPTGLRAGYRALLNVHGAEIRCEVGAILNRLDRRNGRVVSTAPGCLRDQEMGDVQCIPLDPVSLDPAATHPWLGRVVLRFVPPEDAPPPEDPDEEPEVQRTVATGTVMSLVAG